MKNILNVLLPHLVDGNIYTRELGRAYREAGCNLVFGADNLLENNVDIDILHLHWPEAFYRWAGSGSIEERIAHFIRSIDALKAKGSKVIWTVHNIAPHEHPDNPLDQSVYQQVLDRVDLLVHHCPQSRAELAAKYKMPDTVAHVVTPHGHYLGYPGDISREEARRRLGIPYSAYVYLQFGRIRGYKALGTLFQAWRRVRHKDKWLLVAGKYQPPSGWYGWRERLHMILAARNSRITMQLNNIPQDQIQVYLSAADCMVLTHSRGLNSGVAILGMTFGNLVVGPDLGCIGWVLSRGCNLIYPAGDSEALVSVMERAPTLDALQTRSINKATAASWSWEEMARVILDHPAIQQTSVL